MEWRDAITSAAVACRASAMPTHADQIEAAETISQMVEAVEAARNEVKARARPTFEAGRVEFERLTLTSRRLREANETLLAAYRDGFRGKVIATG